jgi:hypothetical protein
MHQWLYWILPCIPEDDRLDFPSPKMEIHKFQHFHMVAFSRHIIHLYEYQRQKVYLLRIWSSLRQCRTHHMCTLRLNNFRSLNNHWDKERLWKLCQVVALHPCCFDKMKCFYKYSSCTFLAMRQNCLWPRLYCP